MWPWQPFLAFYVWGAHWRHLANTTKPSMCIGDAALCKITLSTCSTFLLAVLLTKLACRLKIVSTFISCLVRLFTLILGVLTPKQGAVSLSPNDVFFKKTRGRF